MTPSAIVVASFKKLVLVSLIHRGSLMPLPKFTAQRIKHTVEAESRAYLDVASAYSASHGADKLRRCVEQHAMVFAAVRRPPPSSQLGASSSATHPPFSDP